MSGAYLVLSTFPNAEIARQVAERLVEEKLAACVSLVPGVESIYRWQGAIQRDAEVLALMKTTADRYPEFEARLRELHPYETPEILAVPAERVSAKYLAWLKESLARESD